jgi:hypothetical protein
MSCCGEDDACCGEELATNEPRAAMAAVKSTAPYQLGADSYLQGGEVLGPGQGDLLAMHDMVKDRPKGVLTPYGSAALQTGSELLVRDDIVNVADCVGEVIVPGEG